MIRYVIYAVVVVAGAWFLIKDMAIASDEAVEMSAPAHIEKSKYMAREASILACFDVVNPKAQKYVYSDWKRRNRVKFDQLSEMVDAEFEGASPSLRKALLRKRKEFRTVPTFRTEVLKRQVDMPSWMESDTAPPPSQVDERALEVLGGELSRKSCHDLSMQVRRGQLDVVLPTAPAGNNGNV